MTLASVELTRFGFGLLAITVILLMVLAVVRFLRTLPKSFIARCSTAAIIFLSGAVGFEVLGGWWSAATASGQGLGYYICAVIEESLELIGAASFLFAILDFAGEHVGARIVAETRAHGIAPSYSAVSAFSVQERPVS